MKLKVEVFQVADVQQQLVFTGSPSAILDFLQTLHGAFPYYPNLNALIDRNEVLKGKEQSERWNG